MRTLRGAEFSISPKDGELSCFSSLAIFFCVPTGLLCESCGVLTTVTIHILKKKVSDAIPVRHPPPPPSLQCAWSRAGAVLQVCPGPPFAFAGPSRRRPPLLNLCFLHLTASPLISAFSQSTHLKSFLRGLEKYPVEWTFSPLPLSACFFTCVVFNLPIQCFFLFS